VEASAIPATVGLSRTRTAIGAPLLRIRSDEQLVSMFRSGHDEAFRAIHDRYRPRLFAYTRQMLAGSTADAEDAVQEIFVRAYAGLRASHRELALRAWLYRVAHNRCIDELRRPQTLPTEQIPQMAAGNGPDPVAQTEQRDALRRLIADVQRLPDQQRSALLMRELGGMTYADVSGALGVSIPAVKSLLVRARVGLAQANEARDTSCARIREDLIESHDRGVRTSGLARRHIRDCPSCRQFRSEVRGVSRQLAGFVPALGPIGVIAKLLGLGSAGGGGAAASSGAVAGGGAAAATGAAASVGAIAGAGHVVTLLAAAVVTAGGAIELQHISRPVPRQSHHHRIVRIAHADIDRGGAASGGVVIGSPAAPPATTAGSPAPATTASGKIAPAAAVPSPAERAATNSTSALPISQRLDPDLYYVATALGPGPGQPSTAATPTTGTTPASTPTGGANPAAPAGTGSSSSSAAGAGSSSAAGTGSSSPSSTSSSSTSPAPTGSGTTASTGGTSGQSGASTGSTTSTGSTAGPSAGGATVSPATKRASIRNRSGKSGAKARGSRIVAVFTMTGN
jgi:RNA polymerase sigma factor (sigma-70 family)